MDEIRFPGFSRELQGFFSTLPMHNNLTDQEENVARYKALAYEPLQALYQDLLPIIWEISDALETRPRRCVGSPYTDRRFHPSTPVKDHLYLHFLQSGLEQDVPGLFFALGAAGYSYGVAVHHTTTKGMSALRERVLGDPEAFDAALEPLLRTDFAVCGDSYKRDHYPDRPDTPAKLLLTSRRLCVAVQRPFDEAVCSPAFAEELACAYLLAAPFVRLLLKSFPSDPPCRM